MAKEREPAVKLPHPGQIAIVVRDVDRAVEYYSSTFGWGPFRIREMEINGAIFRGKKGNARLKVAMADGTPSIELIQVLEGETPHTEFLRARGEGVQHLGYRVTNMKELLAQFAQAGVLPVWHNDMGWTAFAYLDTDKIGGVMIELVQVRDPGKAI